MAEDPKELETILRSLLVSSSTVFSANTLEREFKTTEERPFPFRKLGFSNFIDYLRSIPTVVSLQPKYGPNPEVHPVLSAASKHVNDLVVNTKKSRPRKGFNRRKEPLRRRLGPITTSSTYRLSRPAPVSNVYTSRQTQPSFVSNASTSRLSQPAPVSNVYTSRQTQPSFVSNASTSRQSQPASVSNASISCLSQLSSSDTSYAIKNSNEFRELLSVLVFQVAQYRNGIRITHLEDNMTRAHLRNSRIGFSDLLQQAITKNMIYQDGNFLYPKLSAPSPNISVINHSNNNNKSECNGYEDTLEDEYYGDNEEQYPDWENMSEETLSKMTIDKFFQKSDPTNQTVWSYDENTKYNEKLYSSGTEESDEEYILSEKMIANFRSILEKNPDGFWLSELAGKYLENFKVPLDYIDLGFPSAILMVEQLPEVFYAQRENLYGDWKLFDARKLQDLPLQKPSLDNSPSGHANVENHIPNSILENIKVLSELYSDGFRSTELQHLYENHFKKSLAWQTMGFAQLEDFINALCNIVTIKRVTDYHLILPKHHTKSLPSKPFEPVEALTVERDSFLRSTPENVLKTPDDIIPSQEFPPLNKKEVWSDPLLEIEVRISEIVNPHNFSFILSSEYNNLQIMMDDLDKFYKREEHHFYIPPVLVVPGLIVACLFDDYWHRAKIILCNRDTVEIEYIDYGTVVKVKTSELRFLANDFADLPVQACRGELLNIRPPNKEKKWPKESSLKFLELVNNKRLYAQIFDIDWRENQKVYRMIIYDTLRPEKENEIIINESLAEEGFAWNEDQFAELEQNQDDSFIETSLIEEDFAEPLPLQDCSFNTTSSVNSSKIFSMESKGVPIDCNSSTSAQTQKIVCLNSSSTTFKNNHMTNVSPELLVPITENETFCNLTDFISIRKKMNQLSMKNLFS